MGGSVRFQKTVICMKPVTIVFGTVMGNSEACAYEIGADLKKRNIDNEVLGMSSFNHDQLVDDGLLVVVVSTTGHGNPPHNATALYNHLKFEKPDVKGRRFAVMALGSSRYPKFAECGKEFDQMLGALGGTRVMDRVDCDGDYGRPLKQFQSGLYDYIKSEPERYPDFEPPTPPPPAPSASPPPPPSTSTAASDRQAPPPPVSRRRALASKLKRKAVSVVKRVVKA